MKRIQKTGITLAFLLLLAALAGCGVGIQMTPELVDKQAPPIDLPTGEVQEKLAKMATQTLPPGVPAPSQGTPTLVDTPAPTVPPWSDTPAPTAPAGASAAINPQNAARLTATAVQAPEFIETLLWPAADHLWAISTGSMRYPVPLQSAAAGAPVQLAMPENGGPIAWTPDGGRVAVLDGSGMVGVFEPQADGTLSPVGDVLMRANNASFSADGRTLLLTDPEATALTLLNVENGAPLKQLTGFAEGDRIYTAMLSPDGKTVAWRSRGALQFQDVASETLSTLVKTQGMISEARFAPDGSALAVVAGEHLEVYSAADGKQLTRQQLSQPTSALVYSPDGSLLAAAYGNTVQLWDTSTWLPLAPLTGHSAMVAKVSFSPDGKTLVSADDNGELRLWRVQ